MNQKVIDHMRAASHLLPPPGGDVVRECLDEIDRLRTEREALWVGGWVQGIKDHGAAYEEWCEGDGLAEIARRRWVEREGR